MENSLLLKLDAKGKVFKNSLELGHALGLLSDFNHIYAHCLSKSTKYYKKVGVEFTNPIISIKEIKQGSLDSLFTILLPNTLALSAPYVADYSWDLFKNLLEYAELYIGSFKIPGKDLTVHIDNSPNTQMNVLVINANGNVHVGKDVADAFSSCKDKISSLATKVQDKTLDTLELRRVNDERKILGQVGIDTNNCDNLIINTTEELDPDAITMKCRIYSFNKRSKKGRMEIIYDESDSSKSINFEVVGDIDVGQFVDAMHHDSVEVIANVQRVTNTLGESHISYVFPLQINL